MDEREPLTRVVTSLERHLLGEHRLPDFELERDFYWEENRPGSPRALYLAEVAATPPGFRCLLCGARVFSEPSYGHPARNAALRRHFQAELQPLLRNVPAGRQDEVIEDWDRGWLARANLERIDRSSAQAVKRATLPEVARRIAACQAFLLAHYREHGNKDQALQALYELATTDPERHREIVGRAWPYSPETYAGYWKRIPIEERRAAKAESIRREAERKASRPNAGKLTP